MGKDYHFLESPEILDGVKSFIKERHFTSFEKNFNSNEILVILVSFFGNLYLMN